MTRTSVVLGFSIAACVCAATLTLRAQPQREVRVTLSRTTAAPIASAGIYTAPGQPRLLLDSFSALLMEPSTSATFAVRTVRGRNQMVFRDTRPALTRSTESPGFRRSMGALHANARIDGPAMKNVVLTVDVNTSGGIQGRGATSRQGLLTRWDLATKWYWLGVNFATGTTFIVKFEPGGSMRELEGSIVKIENFDAKQSLFLVGTVIDDTLQLEVFDSSDRKVKRADTGRVRDGQAPHLEAGAQAFMAELAFERRFDPLEASFANLSVVEK